VKIEEFVNVEAQFVIADIDDAAANPNRGALDPVTVIMRKRSAGAGWLIVTCFDGAWTCFWGSMGKTTMREFMLSCGPEYVADCLVRRSTGMIGNRKREDIERRYVLRIAMAIDEALRDPAIHGLINSNP